ncbi:hypothetical protein P170DRAFT_252701 [Aspergillus steynii IBT 23096]|uniref:Uncharacterized protein n=1 Tax=Aspergillus steynii IBT 23096 TaxID=1392250 RepID=A0A2I2FYS0_9EURO|nr:uncharacterized protein P170DRAFT_252701 [Aspergillus steynii IBT 23096]PLB45790.1 hypothetical protein P170DRAFT_252701 [Aspergillus steynii IBT 23096]
MFGRIFGGSERDVMVEIDRWVVVGWWWCALGEMTGGAHRINSRCSTSSMASANNDKICQTGRMVRRRV